MVGAPLSSLGSLGWLGTGLFAPAPMVQISSSISRICIWLTTRGQSSGERLLRVDPPMAETLGLLSMMRFLDVTRGLARSDTSLPHICVLTVMGPCAFWRFFRRLTSSFPWSMERARYGRLWRLCRCEAHQAGWLLPSLGTGRAPSAVRAQRVAVQESRGSHLPGLCFVVQLQLVLPLVTDGTASLLSLFDMPRGDTQLSFSSQVLSSSLLCAVQCVRSDQCLVSKSELESTDCSIKQSVDPVLLSFPSAGSSIARGGSSDILQDTMTFFRRPATLEAHTPSSRRKKGRVRRSVASDPIWGDRRHLAISRYVPFFLLIAFSVTGAPEHCEGRSPHEWNG